MQRSTVDLWVGLFVAAGIAALLVLAFRAGNLSSVNLGNAYVVSASFENIGGLKVRAPVKASGVVVGRVDAIRFDPEKYEAQVILKIDQQYRFPRDTSAQILTSGLLGEQYVGLSPGGDSAVLKAGDKMQMTQSAIVLEQLIGQLLYDKAQGD